MTHPPTARIVWSAPALATAAGLAPETDLQFVPTCAEANRTP